jgi:ribose transport system ATP-binding protein
MSAVTGDAASRRQEQRAEVPSPARGDAITITGLDKAYSGVPVLRNVSLRVPAGAIVGMVGENGAGKSTLMNVLGGVVPRDAGTITLADEPYEPRGPSDAAASGIAFIHQELNLFGNLSVAENLSINRLPSRGRLPLLDMRVLRAAAAESLATVGLDVAPSTPVETLSAGERQLVEIARAVASDARVIIFDEPTTSLTAREARRLFALMRRLRDDGRTLIFISHALEDVLSLCEHVVVLRDGEVVSQGTTDGYTVSRLVTEMVGRSIDQLFPDVTSTPRDEVVLDVDAVSQPGVLHDVSLRVRAGEVVGIFGLMGSGRTELARVVFGLDPHATGRIADPSGARRRRTPRASIRAGVGFVTEDRRQQGLLMPLPVADNIVLPTLNRYRRAGGVVDRRGLLAACGQIASRLRIKGGAIETEPVTNLSGGNQQKVVIGKWLLRESRVLILDEPTRGVDVGAKHDLYVTIDQLASRGTGVLVISSELEELVGTCHRILVMRAGEIVEEFSRADFDGGRILAAAFGHHGQEPR